jgi:2'-5' RNA ligase
MTGANGGANPSRGRVRLLVALDLPERVRREAESWQQEALTDPALRLNHGLRIILMFLGHRPQREVGRYLEAMRELCASAPAPLVELGDVVAKGPTLELPRVFALPAKSPEAEVLRIGLRSVFTNQGLYIYEPRERPFWPHLTVARVRTADHKSRRPEVVRNLPDRPIPPGLRGPFEGLRVGLYRPEMRPDGALLADGQGRSAGVDLRDASRWWTASHFRRCRRTAARSIRLNSSGSTGGPPSSSQQGGFVRFAVGSSISRSS